LPLNEKEKDNKDWAFQLSVSAWIKKNKVANLCDTSSFRNKMKGGSTLQL